jgi:hypothetical protein
MVLVAHNDMVERFDYEKLTSAYRVARHVNIGSHDVASSPQRSLVTCIPIILCYRLLFKAPGARSLITPRRGIGEPEGANPS